MIWFKKFPHNIVILMSLVVPLFFSLLPGLEPFVVHIPMHWSTWGLLLIHSHRELFLLTKWVTTWYVVIFANHALSSLLCRF